MEEKYGFSQVARIKNVLRKAKTTAPECTLTDGHQASAEGSQPSLRAHAFVLNPDTSVCLSADTQRVTQQLCLQLKYKVFTLQR